MIAILTANGYECVEAICPFNLLKRAGLDVRFVGLNGKTESGSCGVTVECAMTAAELIESGEKIDMLVLPGGLPGATNLDEAPETDKLIEITEKCGGFFAAICAAPSILGDMGLLNGKEAICYPGFEDRLKGAVISKNKVVSDGKIITAAGMGVAYDMGIEIVRVLCGDKKANELKEATIHA